MEREAKYMEERGRENRIKKREKAREEICKERGTPWDQERKELDSGICAWNREEKREAEQEREDEKRWNGELKSATRFHGAKSSKEIEAVMITEHGAEKRIKEDEEFKRQLARMEKFDAMVEAEADRWTEELTRAAAAESNPYVESELGRDHRYHCMPRSYTSTLRRKGCGL
ncbi:hypothetical protein OCU04_008558 [Sclerotinia nivalis]|uniref:Uncharacterized protein n=1 Tax=Sclerotinia nivalis TaxID=352851 RepID=A0A9X0AIB5_9HELO|nr:hypothetical protein OCU04_008558 [Sclerotinia nivalis]